MAGRGEHLCPGRCPRPEAGVCWHPVLARLRRRVVNWGKNCQVLEDSSGYSRAWKTMPARMPPGRQAFACANTGPVLTAIAGYNGTYLNNAKRWSPEISMLLLHK